MSAISPVNPGVGAVYQLVSAAPGPISSALASPAVQDALNNASPQDIVDLSLGALQLQETDNLFGGDLTNPASSGEGSGAFSFLG
jgi:hypothetical protein